MRARVPSPSPRLAPVALALTRASLARATPLERAALALTPAALALALTPAALALALGACRTGGRISPPVDAAPEPAEGGGASDPAARPDAAAQADAAEAPDGAGPMSREPPAERGRPSVVVIRWNNTQPPVTEVFPDSPHHAGQSPRGAWMGTDGVVFVAGQMQADGGQDGAVWRRSPSARWELSRVQPGTPLGHVHGASSDDVWVTGRATVLRFDGKAWAVEKIPGLEPGSELHGIWGKTGDVWIASARGERGALHRWQKGRWSIEARGRPLRAVTGAGATVWAAGDGAILRRLPDGTWKTEHADPAARFTAMFASAENDVWAAGTALMRSAGDGKWIAVDLPGGARATAVWGRNRTDIHAGTDLGLFVYDTRGWTRVPKLRGSAAIVGSGDEVFAVHEDAALAP